jgi:predicted esterase
VLVALEAVVCLLALAPGRAAPAVQAAGSGADDVAAEALPRALAAFWSAPGPDERAERIPAVLAAQSDPGALLAALRAGPVYSEQVPRGRVLRSRVGAGGQDHPWLLLVPDDYDPARRHMLRVELHGGMGCPAWPADGSWADGWTPRTGHLVLLPAGWWDSMWWTAGQVENLAAILDEVKRTWNVDENRVVLFGGSDGCIGSCFHAFRDPTAYAAFGGTIGCPVRLTNPTLRVDGQMHLSNLSGQRFFLVNGGRDRLFPVQDIRDYWELFREHGAEVDYREYPQEGHGFPLSAEDERDLARFLFGTRRDPLPDTLSWATERTDRYARRSWLQVLELGAAPSDAPELAEDVVMPRICTGKYRSLRAPPARPYGRVDLVRDGNRVRARTAGVRRRRRLLSPDEFDFAEPVGVELNGAVVHDALVAPDARVLLGQAARDLDRTMLFTARLELEVP